MAELKVRQLDDRVVEALKARAKGRGVSLEEEVRATLTASVNAKRAAFARRCAAVRALSRQNEGKVVSDSVQLIREERDAWG